MKVILFGTGRYYQRWKHSFDFNEVVVLLDNDPEKQGQLLDGYRIDHPNHIRRYEYDSVFILVKNPEMIRDQLKQMNIPEQKIYDVKNPGLFQLIPTVISFMTNTEKRGIRVLLLTHTMDLTGAPLVLFDVARILSDNGLQIHVISLADGPLREYYLRAGISVTIAESMLLGSTQINFFYQWAQLIFVNTLVFYPILNVIRNDGKRVVWWLHEEENFYREYEIDVDAQESFDDMQIYGVGNRVMRSFHRFFPKASICELLYGIEERPTLDKEHVSVVFAFIGTCDHRKGEDVFRAATRELNKQIGMRVEYWIIGEIDNEKEEEYRAIDGVRLLGAMAHEEVMKKYEEIDVVVCPSRNDPMPVVVTEGMMMKKVCIVSEDVGQATILTDGESGLICRTGDAEDLCKKMKWAIDHKDRCVEMGNKAHELYKQFFSMEKFEHNVMKIMECLE